jgi:tetratricopeptide (TPR) repeat protein
MRVYAVSKPRKTRILWCLIGTVAVVILSFLLYPVASRENQLAVDQQGRSAAHSVEREFQDSSETDLEVLKLRLQNNALSEAELQLCIVTLKGIERKADAKVQNQARKLLYDCYLRVHEEQSAIEVLLQHTKSGIEVSPVQTSSTGVSQPESANEDVAKELFAKADDFFYSKNQYNNAKQLYEAIVAEHNGLMVADWSKIKIGECFDRLRKEKEAIQQYRDVISATKWEEVKFQAYKRLFEALINAHQWDNAIATAKDMEQDLPSGEHPAFAMLQLAEGYRSKGFDYYPDAYSALRGLIKKYPDSKYAAWAENLIETMTVNQMDFANKNKKEKGK